MSVRTPFHSLHFFRRSKLTWSIWQALLKTFAWAFTCRGFHRFAEWITAMALNVEEHTITQSVLALQDNSVSVHHYCFPCRTIRCQFIIIASLAGQCGVSSSLLLPLQDRATASKWGFFIR